MGTYHCCGERPTTGAPCNTTQQPRSTPTGNIFRRVIRFVKPLLPAFLLAIIPKCPFCLAAYLALGTGIGLSVTSARYLHISLLCAGIIPLSLLAATHLARLLYNESLIRYISPQRKWLFISTAGILIGYSLLWLC
ncbi:hypothetical protein [Chitinophaga rhizophila]|uniref:Urease accessory protein UreH-like transmembrane domain-containing protein n=1 Tax=Chitinophaga rhizophila TaxID=2866212 RepID=A0ABS7G6K2_9BACT|nr:hypothetical protein [Chitinophaga rhizophila]MBW8682790.1 hypothetical protein [Chitinophaga rhizophila]